LLKLLLSGLWLCLATAAASYAAVSWKTGAKAAEEPAYIDGLDYEKTRAINVPMIAEGKIQGYVVAQFVFTVDAKTKSKLTVPPEVFVLDEAFRTIYADEKLDFRQLEKYDLPALMTAIRERVNARLEADVIKDVLVEEFNYLAKDEAQG
jgi:hypothetical protein